jgi:hypothetical protein
MRWHPPGATTPAAAGSCAIDLICLAAGRRWVRRRRCWDLVAMRELSGADMADTTVEAKPTRRRRNWREYENRASKKYLAKRVSDDDHEAVTRYAKDHGTDVAKLLTPFVEDLIRRAHDYCGQLDEVSEPAKAS